MSIKNEKLLNSNNYWSKPEFFLAPMEYRRFQIGCVFKPYIFIHNLIYVCFGIILKLFYINFSRQAHQIEQLWGSIIS